MLPLPSTQMTLLLLTNPGISEILLSACQHQLFHFTPIMHMPPSYKHFKKSEMKGSSPWAMGLWRKNGQIGCTLRLRSFLLGAAGSSIRSSCHLVSGGHALSCGYRVWMWWCRSVWLRMESCSLWSIVYIFCPGGSYNTLLVPPSFLLFILLLY